MIGSIVQIIQTPGILNIDADPGSFSLRQPKAELHINTEPGKIEINNHSPQLEVDNSRAFAAYNGGNYLEMNQRIYSGIRQIFLQALAERVEAGNRAAAIHQSGNTIAEIYGTDWKPVPFPEMRGAASMDNVDVRYYTSPPDIRISKSQVEIQFEANKPEIEYFRGKLDIYMKQYPSIQFMPPKVDIIR